MDATIPETLEVENVLYSKLQALDQGAWMTWQQADTDTDARQAIEHFRRKYQRKCRQIAIGKNHYSVPKDIELVKMQVPVGQIWIR